jgi:hypothetical protein
MVQFMNEHSRRRRARTGAHGAGEPKVLFFDEKSHM